MYLVVTGGIYYRSSRAYRSPGAYRHDNGTAYCDKPLPLSPYQRTFLQYQRDTMYDNIATELENSKLTKEYAIIGTEIWSNLSRSSYYYSTFPRLLYNNPFHLCVPRFITYPYEWFIYGWAELKLSIISFIYTSCSEFDQQQFKGVLHWPIGSPWLLRHDI